jgi:hypothetical protein
MSTRDGAWKGDAKIAGGVDVDNNTHPLNCTTGGTLEIEIAGAGIPLDVIVDNIVPVSQSGAWTVGVNNFPTVQTIQPWPLTIRAEYSGANLLVYFADAQPGTLSSASTWRIRKLTYDGNGNFSFLSWPNADTSFSYIWDNRSTYTYS